MLRHDCLEPLGVDVEVEMPRTQSLRSRRKAAQVGVRELTGRADLDEPRARIAVREELDDDAARVAEQEIRQAGAVHAHDDVGVGEELGLLAQLSVSVQTDSKPYRPSASRHRPR